MRRCAVRLPRPRHLVRPRQPPPGRPPAYSSAASAPRTRAWSSASSTTDARQLTPAPRCSSLPVRPEDRSLTSAAGGASTRSRTPTQAVALDVHRSSPRPSSVTVSHGRPEVGRSQRRSTAVADHVGQQPRAAPMPERCDAGGRPPRRQSASSPTRLHPRAPAEAAASSVAQPRHPQPGHGRPDLGERLHGSVDWIWAELHLRPARGWRSTSRSASSALTVTTVRLCPRTSCTSRATRSRSATSATSRWPLSWCSMLALVEDTDHGRWPRLPTDDDRQQEPASRPSSRRWPSAPRRRLRAR